MLLKEIKEITLETATYLYKCLLYAKPIWVLFTTVISYVLFPDNSYYPASYALIAALLLDIASKYYAIAHKNGGFFNALKTKKITSESLWIGTRKKLVGVLIVMILCGLSYRLTPFSAIPVFFQTVCFSILFYREAQSVIENFIDAGYEDLRWMLVLVKKKQKEVIQETLPSIDEEEAEAITNNLDNIHK